MIIGAGFDKGLILAKSAAGITTAYQYSPIVNSPAPGTLTPTNACMQFSGAARALAVWARITLVGGSSITKVTLSVESAYGNYLDAAGTEVAVDLLTAPWAQILSTVHLAGGVTNVDSEIAAAAGVSKLVLVTCALPPASRNLRVGLKADVAGVSGDSVLLFAAAL